MTTSARVLTMFSSAFLLEVKAEEYTLVLAGLDYDDGLRTVRQVLNVGMLDEVAEDAERDHKRYGWEIPKNLDGEAAKTYICESFESKGADVARIYGKDEIQRAEAKSLNKFVESLKLPGHPGSIEWFDALSRMIDCEAGENSGERRAERYAEMRFGAQSEEGFNSDSDTATANAHKLQKVLDWAEKSLPLSWALWKESQK